METIVKKLTMPKELGEPWVKALRSGEYKQGKNRLRVGTDNYCCLGVYCKINNIPISLRGDIAKGYNGYEFMDQHVGNEFTTRLYEANDQEGKTFNEIADMIEKNVEFV